MLKDDFLCCPNVLIKLTYVEQRMQVTVCQLNDMKIASHTKIVSNKIVI